MHIKNRWGVILPQVNELKFIAKCKCVHPVHIEVEALKISGCYGLGIGMKTVGNGRENTQTIHVPVFFFAGNGNRIGGRENESDITGYREWKISVGNMSITIGKQ